MLNIFQYLYNKKGKSIPLKIKLAHNLPITTNDLVYNGWLDLSYSRITSLPNNLTVNSILDIGSTQISSLPNNLFVKLDMDIGYTNISELPNDLYVGGDLYCRRTPLAEKIMNDFSLLEKYKKQVKGEIEW